MESVLQNINKLNRSLEGVIAVRLGVLSDVALVGMGTRG